MLFKKLSNLSEQNKIILGTVQFGLEYGINNSTGKPSESSVNDILNVAFEERVRILDTAEAYGNAHEVIGNYHKSSDNKFKIITKFSAAKKGLSANLIQRINQNLAALNVDSLYCYMFHSFNDFQIYYEDHKEDIERLKVDGLVEKFGVSVYLNDEIEALLKYDDIDDIQLPFNLLDNNKQRREVLLKAKNKGIEIHTRSVYLQGLFFKDIHDMPDKLIAMKRELSAINDLAELCDIKMSNLALGYVSQQDCIDKILIGVDTVEQLKLNLETLRLSIPVEVLNKIDELDIKDKSLLNPSNWN